jgi:hypothetical protein
MKTWWWWRWAAVVLLGGALPVAAEEERPTFVLMDQQTGKSRLGVDGSLIFPKDVEAYGIRFDAYAQFVTRSHFGGYLRFGVTHLHNQGLRESDLTPNWEPFWPDHKLHSPTAGTNMEFGGFYLLGLPDFGLDVTFHVAGVLPTGPSLDDWNALANLFTFMGRVSDYEQIAPGMGWIRGGVIAAGTQGLFFYQVDVSASMGFSKHDNVSNFGVFHTNLGGGGTFGAVSLLAELANMVTISSDDDSWIHAVSFSAIFGLGRVRPRVSYMLPFDSEGTFGNVFLVGFTWDVESQRVVYAASAAD